MKVGELIDVLSKFDRELDVVTYNEHSLQYIEYSDFDHLFLLYKKDGEYYDSVIEALGIDDSMEVEVVVI